MRLLNWLRAASAPTTAAKPRPRRRLAVERLEDRTVPAVFIVANTDDCGTGSLREAIHNANTTAGADTITFDLSDSLKTGDWWTISPQTQLPFLLESVVIDGWSQPGAGRGLAPKVMLDGSDPALPGTSFGLIVNADDCTVRGLAIGNFGGGWAVYISGCADTVVQGCYLGIDPSGTTSAFNNQGVNDAGFHSLIGGPTYGDGNVVSGNRIGISSWGYGVTIQGNRVGTNAAGTARIPNWASGVTVGGDPAHALPSMIGGLTPCAGNLISGNGWGGVDFESGIKLAAAKDVRVVGNLIGPDVAGTSRLPNTPLFSGGTQGAGIVITGQSSNVIIGGTEPGARNVISANGGAGIRIENGTGVVVQGNSIGTDVSGMITLGNNNDGIVAGGGGVLIGGTVPSAGNLIVGNGTTSNRHAGVFLRGANYIVRGNVIRDNTAAGVYIGFDGQAVGTTVSGNAIYGNYGVGIDLLRDINDNGGVTPNTYNDSQGHVGPNNLQNHPELAPIIRTSAGATITGTLTQLITPNTQFSIEFFANTDEGDLGPVEQGEVFRYGEGKRYLGAISVTTNASGVASIPVYLLELSPGDRYVTATATNLATGDTSEFSRVVAIPAQAASTVTATGGNFVYDGQTRPATGSVTGPGGEVIGTPTFTYEYQDEDGNWVPTGNGGSHPPVEPGYYRATGSFTGNDIYTPGSAIAFITIFYEARTLTDVSKAFNAGRAIPIKLQLVDANGANVSSAGVGVAAIRLERVNADGSRTTVTLEDAGNANPGNLFRYDADLGGYIFNLSTKGLSAGAYDFTWMAEGDPTEHRLTLRLV